MYNTTPVAWVDNAGSTFNNLAPLAIGWWPRYASALPGDTLAQTADMRGALLRCRSYAWANFPIRFHNTYFTGDEPSQVTIIDSGANLFNLTALALPGGFAWDDYLGTPIDLTSTGVQTFDVKAAFVSPLFNTTTGTSPRFTDSGTTKAVDGADLRVIWTYRDQPTSNALPAAHWLQDVAISGNRAPMIGPVFIRGHAPCVVLSVER
jgi:hypothetical protein